VFYLLLTLHASSGKTFDFTFLENAEANIIGVSIGRCPMALDFLKSANF